MQRGYSRFSPSTPFNLPMDNDAYQKTHVGFNAPDFDEGKRSSDEPRAGFGRKLNPPRETLYGKSSVGFNAPDFDEKKRSPYEPKIGFGRKLRPKEKLPYKEHQIATPSGARNLLVVLTELYNPQGMGNPAFEPGPPADPDAYRKTRVGFNAPDFDEGKRSNYEPRVGFGRTLRPPRNSLYSPDRKIGFMTESERMAQEAKRPASTRSLYVPPGAGKLTVVRNTPYGIVGKRKG